jgi:glycosyltransferase involved in cell wall biosynthesis
MQSLSVVIPAYNEQESIRQVASGIRDQLQSAGIPHELIIVVDGAADNTAREAAVVADRVIEHPLRLGYGRSLKTGILAASHDLVAIIDADGTYPAARLPELIKEAGRFDMVVGARSGNHYQGGVFKRLGRWVFRRLAEFSAGQTIPDINSGLRVFRKSDMVRFFPIISAGYSFTTTSTLAYLHNDLLIKYVPIEYHRRKGRSHVRYVRDSLRALQIIIEAILRVNPIKVFLLLAAPAALVGVALVVWGGIAGNWTLIVCAVITLCTSALLLGMGFTTVALVSRGSRWDSVTATHGEPDRDARA